LVEVKLLLLLGAHLLIAGLPGAAAALVAARRGVTNVPVLLATAMAVSGATAMLVFWMYFAAPVLGEVFAWATLLGSVEAGVLSVRGGGVDRTVLRQLATPLALWFLGSSFLVFLGFIHGGTGSALLTAEYRFTGWGLPSDNDIPRFFAAWFYAHGHTPRPPVYSSFLFSDRPPLQVGYVLMQAPFGSHATADLNYQLLGVILQQLWIVGLWALLLAARVGRITRALAVIMVLLSDLAIVNGFFVWPKMLAAAMLLAAAALVATPLWSELRRSAWAAALVAGLFGLAMLGHGSSIFGIIPLALVAAVRGVPSWRWLAIGVAVGAAFVVPWSSYQKYADPPGNRLTKEALAGLATADSRSTLQDVVDAYRRAGIGGTFHNKEGNFETMAGIGGAAPDLIKGAVDATDSGKVTSAVDDIRAVFFYFFLPSLGLLAIVPVLMAIGRRRRAADSAEWGLAMTCYAIAGVGCLIWGLVMFGNWTSTTVLHLGSYALPVLALSAGVAGVRAVFPRFALWWVGFNALMMLAIYLPADPSYLPDPGYGPAYLPLPAVLTVASLVGFAALALKGDDTVRRWLPVPSASGRNRDRVGAPGS
jgi:hypothetical protein